jgi:ABC-type transport system involved in multi-copper enzyme maturation permease subunit
LPSHEPRAPVAPVLCKELRELATGSSLWVLLLLMSPLVGYSFIQAVSLYAEASRPALTVPELARQLSPFDGVLVPTLGGFYLAITLLYPFIAIRLIAAEKASGGLKLLVQLPYRLTDLVAAKFAAVIAAWLIALIPLISALVWWGLLGGHLDARETATLMLGHLLYALLIGAISFLAAALTEGGATAAILALAVTIGSWVLDFAALDRGSVSSLLAALSLTSLLKPYEHGLLSVPAVLCMLIAIVGLLALTAIWLPPGVLFARRVKRSAFIVVAAVIFIAVASQATTVLDVTPDRRNSFALADEQLLGQLPERLLVTVHMASSDPRVADLDRKVLARLKRAMPRVTVRIAEEGNAGPFGTGGGDDYGQIVFTYHGKSAATRSTGAGEILPILYELAGVGLPAPSPAGSDEPGDPLVADASSAAFWFYGALPLMFVGLWWLASNRRISRRISKRRSR